MKDTEKEIENVREERSTMSEKREKERERERERACMWGYPTTSLSLSLCRFHVFARIDDTRDAFGMIARSFFSAFLSGGVLARDGPFACVARHGCACLAAEGMCCADFLFARERKEETGRHRDATSILLVRMDRL